MRCHYLSDLHLESQSLEPALPRGDVLIIAGDLCHARCLDPARTDKYSIDQRDRVGRLVERALANFPHVLLIAGNHEHYDGVFDDTIGLMRRFLPGVTVLDDEAVEIGGVRFFGSTLWSDFQGRSETAMNAIRRRMGEYFFVKTYAGSDAGTLPRFRPEDALKAHDLAKAALRREVTKDDGKRTVVITHHAPSRLGLNPRFAGNGLDPAYASSLDDEMSRFENVPVWVHGHTHIAKTYRVGNTVLRSNALGFAAKGQGAPGFSLKAHFDIA
jgi:Icc-related predicted phosphoesterase